VADDPRFRCPPRGARIRALCCSVRPQRGSSLSFAPDFQQQVPPFCRF
jgi:hypothetical protein